MPLLDMFRFVGAISVFFVHAHTSYHVSTPLANYGTQWLTWFFMLSGLVLSLRYAGSTWKAPEAKKYAVARIVRLLPAYLFAVIISTAVVGAGLWMHGMQYFSSVTGRVSIYTFALPEDVSIGCLFQNALAHALFIQTFVGTKLCGGALLINPPLWSAAIEMWVYLLFPWVLTLVWRIRHAGAVCLSVASMVLFDAFYVYATVEENDLAIWDKVLWSVHFNPLIRLLELTLGVMLGRLWVLTEGFKQTMKMTKPIFYLCVFLSVWGTFVFHRVGYTTAYWFSATGLPWALLALIAMLYFSRMLGRERGRIAAWCASMSYIIYCSHWCLMELFALLGLRSIVISTWGNWPAIFLCLGFVLLVSQCFLRVEKILAPRLNAALLKAVHVAK